MVKCQFAVAGWEPIQRITHTLAAKEEMAFNLLGVSRAICRAMKTG